MSALYTVQTDTEEPHNTSMMSAHGVLPKRFVPVLGFGGGTWWTLNTVYKYQIRFTHVEVMFLATCVALPLFFSSATKAKHLRQCRRICALPSDAQICSRPNVFIAQSCFESNANESAVRL